MEFRQLRADEIDCRVGTQTDRGISLLLYKDARCDMRLLDETVGSENWQDKYYECKGNLFCSVGIKTADGWIWKDDCGTESNTEKEKGEASDAFKRACFRWGIGRELYTAPFIWVGLDKLELDSRGKVKSKYRVKDIGYENGAIVRLCIADQKGKDVYTFGYEKAKKNEDEIICESCGKPLEAVIGKDGKFVAIAKIKEESIKRTGKVLCAECLKGGKNA